MTSAARQFGELTRRGAGAAWKAVGSRKVMAIVSSALRQVRMIKPSGTAAASKTVGRASAGDRDLNHPPSVGVQFSSSPAS